MAKGTQRRLTTIVAADIAGYSRLVGADEEGTLAALQGHRDELINELIGQYGGRVANTAGDSILMEFPSTVDAVRCAISIQQGMEARNTDVSPEGRIEFRIGINVGDVIVQGDDLLGDGVNIAARLEGLAEPGGIALSSNAHEYIDGKVKSGFTDGGEHAVRTSPARCGFGVGDGTEMTNSLSRQLPKHRCHYPTSLSLRCFRSTICQATQSRSSSPMVLPRMSSPHCPAFARCS